MNLGSELFEVLPIKYYFIAGAHIDRDINSKQYITSMDEDVEDLMKNRLKVFVTKAPILFKVYPLNIAVEVLVKTNTKLNLILENHPLIPENELKNTEYHVLKYEGHI